MVTVLHRSVQVGGVVQHQGILEAALRVLFKGEDIEQNVRKSFNVRSPHSGFFLECDVWIQRLRLCFEFQDPHHYATTWDANTPLSIIKESDSLKGSLARSMGETLIEVPCWWDGSMRSLASTIHFARPDLDLNAKGEHIPLNPPQHFFLSIIPDVGELMLASFPPVEFKNQISPENSWWLGEKYDGIRACWNPRTKYLYSRNAGVLHLSPSFRRAFGRIYLDGELWFGRGLFIDTQKLSVHTDDSPTNWSLLRFVVFDVPSTTHYVSFEERYSKLIRNRSSVFVCTAFRILCTRGRQLTVILKVLLEGGGEGVIMRKPKTMYEHGRSPNLLKLKAARGDKEALVIKHLPTTNSYVLQLPDGTTFSAKLDESPSTSQEYKKGDVVTFTYENFSRNSIPVNPKIVRARKDLSWREVLAQESKPTQLGELSGKRIGNQHLNASDAQEPRKQKLRNFYESLASSLGLDPRDPNTWYNMSRSSVMEFKGGASALVHYGGSLVHSFTDIFSELNLEKEKFATTTHHYWSSMGNRRKFFEKYASERGFDPLVPENWYSTRVDSMEYSKGGGTIKSLYNGSMIAALLHVFPELHWNEAKFDNLRKSYWSDPINIKKFFISFAHDHSFDPLAAENWYNINRTDIVNTKLGRTFLGFYDGSIVSALLDVFPDIGLQESKFPIAYNFWKDIGNRRAFFEKFAAANNFDYLNVNAWYDLHPNEITTNKDAEKILKYYKGNIGVALRHLFPELGVELSKVPKTLDYWKYDENKRRFFEKFAKKRKFDPLVAANWYNVMTRDIEDAKGMGMIKDSTFVETLCRIFPEVHFDKLRFKVIPFKFLNDPKNRRHVFESYAQQEAFDPLVPENWYDVRVKAFARAAKSGGAVLSYYNYNLATALRALFPEVNFDVEKFNAPPKDYWNDINNRKKYFVNVAKRLGFDPLSSKDWHSTTFDAIRKKGIKLPGWYDGDLAQTLLTLFPNIGLESSKLYHIRPREYFATKENRKEFMIDFAKDRGFDPLFPHGWYSVTSRMLIEKIGGRTLLSFYSNKLREALLDLFPNIGI